MSSFWKILKCNVSGFRNFTRYFLFASGLWWVWSKGNNPCLQECLGISCYYWSCWSDGGFGHLCQGMFFLLKRIISMIFCCCCPNEPLISNYTYRFYFLPIGPIICLASFSVPSVVKIYLITRNNYNHNLRNVCFKPLIRTTVRKKYYFAEW